MKKISLVGFYTAICFTALTCSTAFAAEPPKTPLPLSSIPGQGFTPDGLKRIDAFFADQIGNNKMPGAVLAVAKNGN